MAMGTAGTMANWRSILLQWQMTVEINCKWTHQCLLLPASSIVAHEPTNTRTSSRRSRSLLFHFACGVTKYIIFHYSYNIYIYPSIVPLYKINSNFTSICIFIGIYVWFSISVRFHRLFGRELQNFSSAVSTASIQMVNSSASSGNIFSHTANECGTPENLE